MFHYDKNRARFLLDNTKATIELLFESDATHFLGISGGKDSAASAAVAKFSDIDINLFACDTDFEKPETYKYISEFAETYGSEIRVVKRISTEQEFVDRRYDIMKKWREWYTPALRSKAKQRLGVREMIPPMSEEQIFTALSVMVRSDNEFRNRIILHGSMPKKSGKFCSLELKTELAWNEVINAYLESEDHQGEDVVWWSGVRAQESEKRSQLPLYEKCGMDESGYVFNLRPIFFYTHEEVFSILRYMGLPWNPLYEKGDKRVGCNECLEANKAAIRNSFTRDPSSLPFISNLEREVALVNRKAVIEGKTHIPFFQEAYRLKRYNNWATAEQVFEWSKTKRGSEEIDDSFVIRSCDSVYGLCD